MTVTAQEARKSGAVAAGSLDAERVDAPQRRRPRLELAVAAAVNTDREITQTGAQVIDRDRDMDVFVSVDPDDDLPRRKLWDAGHCRYLQAVSHMPAGRASGQDCDGSIP